MAWIAGLAGSVIGDLFSQQGQQQTNAMQLAMMKQNEQWQEYMSDTQMQRRVTDLKAAGLNPMLAVNTPGAAMPGFQQPNLPNPSAAFGDLGAQVNSAMQLGTQQAQIANLMAGARKQSTEADYIAGPQSDLTSSQKGLVQAQQKVQEVTSSLLMPAQAQASKAAAALDDSSRRRLEQQIESGDIAAQVRLLGAQTSVAGAQAHLARVDALMDRMSTIEKQYSMPFVIQKLGVQLQQMRLQIPELNSLANYFSTKMGQELWLQRQAQSAIGTGTDLIRALRPGLGGGSSFSVSGSSGFPGDFGGQNPVPVIR